jgi:SAM-dependent methyltransferase
MRILDLGCGRGGPVEQLGHPLELVVGVDPDLRSLLEHRLDLPRLAALSEHLPFADRSFDLIFASWLLEHLAKPPFTFEEISRVLCPGGVLVFLTPNGRHPLARLNRGLGRFSRLQRQLVERFYGRSGEDTFPTHYRANTMDALGRLARHSSLQLVSLHAIPDPTYLAFTPSLFRLTSWFEDRLPAHWKLHLVGAMQRTT